MLTFSLNKSSDSIVKDMSSRVFNPTTDEGRQWLSELWFKALEGKVDNSVNVNAYGYVCEQNTKMAKNKKETALLTVDDVNDGKRGVSETVASYVDDNIDYIVECSDIKTIVDEFVEAHEYLCIEEGSRARSLRLTRRILMNSLRR